MRESVRHQSGPLSCQMESVETQTSDRGSKTAGTRQLGVTGSCMFSERVEQKLVST